MNGNNILLDTNIVLYLLNGEETLIPLLEEKNLFSIIMATSLWLNMPLITADHDFKKIDIADLIYFKR
jgi:predicted nucleic acid-binding protein